MNNLQLINTENFNNISCDVYSDGKRICMSRKQIGEALGYSDPQKAIDNIHAKHSGRLDNLTLTLRTRGKTGQEFDTTFYNQRGIMEICRWSRQPLADQFMDWVWDIIEAYRDGTLVAMQSVQAPTLTEAQIAEIIDEKLSQFKADALAELKADMTQRYEALLKPATFNITSTTKTAIQDPIDIIREAIEPLAKAFNDNSAGYNATYRKVYARMNVSWPMRQTRYKNLHGNKNKPSKLRLIADDQKLLKMFISAVNDIKDEMAVKGLLLEGAE